MIAAFFFLKAVRCRDCGARHYFPSWVPERRSTERETWEPTEAGLPQLQSELIGLES
jgi:hypothetical protein